MKIVNDKYLNNLPEAGPEQLAELVADWQGEHQAAFLQALVSKMDGWGEGRKQTQTKEITENLATDSVAEFCSDIVSYYFFGSTV